MKKESMKLPQTIYGYYDRSEPGSKILLTEDSLDGFSDDVEAVGVYELQKTGSIRIGATAFVPHPTAVVKAAKSAKAKQPRKR